MGAYKKRNIFKIVLTLATMVAGLQLAAGGSVLAAAGTYYYTCPSSGGYTLSQKAGAKNTVDILCISDIASAGGTKTAPPQSQAATSPSASKAVVNCVKNVVPKAITGAVQFSCSDGKAPTVTLTIPTPSSSSDSVTLPHIDPITDPATDSSFNGAGGFMTHYIAPFVNFLAGAVGVVVVISIIIGAIQYSSAGGDAQKVAAARGRIRNAILALITFVFLYAFLQWLIPGGVGL